jgi:DNA-binding response OmpR family regulator
LRCRDDARQIVFFDQPLPTTRFEYEVLKALIRSPDRVFTRDSMKGY